MRLDRTAIKQLQKRVYYGLYADVANELKVTRASVMNVVAGKWYNQRIIDECIKHDFYFRTGVDFSGKLISFKDANLRFFNGLWRKRHYILACIRWLGVSFTPQAKAAWRKREAYRF